MSLATIDDKPVAVAAPAVATVGVPLDLLVANPRNPRQSLGDLEDLKSIATRQLQPCLVVSAKSYLTLWPEDVPTVGSAQYVVVNGCRRLAAAKKFGRSDLLIIHDESVAESRGELLGAAVEENIGRQDFDVIEEAVAVEAVVSEYPSAAAAAQARGWTTGWISQRRALLKLSPEMQKALRAGELAVRDARRLARVPAEQQVSAWQAEQEVAAARRQEREAERKQASGAPPQKAASPTPPPRPSFTAVNDSDARDEDPEQPSSPPPSFTAVNDGVHSEASVPEPRTTPKAASAELDWSDAQDIFDAIMQRMSAAGRVELITKLLHRAD